MDNSEYSGFALIKLLDLLKLCLQYVKLPKYSEICVRKWLNFTKVPVKLLNIPIIWDFLPTQPCTSGIFVEISQLFRIFLPICSEFDILLIKLVECPDFFGIFLIK